MGFFSELFKTETEQERQYREFLENKSKEFISILPKEITEEFVSYDLSQFETIDKKIDFLFHFFEDIKLYGQNSRECMNHFFNKEYSKIKCYIYDIREGIEKHIEIFKDGNFLGLKKIRIEINIYDNRVDFRFQESPKDNYEDDYSSHESDSYDRGGFLYQRTYCK